MHERLRYFFACLSHKRYRYCVPEYVCVRVCVHACMCVRVLVCVFYFVHFTELINLYIFLYLFVATFQRFIHYNKMKGLLSCPTCVDGNNTFFLGYFYSPNHKACEAKCLNDSRCYIYTFYSMNYPDYKWYGQCIGASYETHIHSYEYYVFSGVRSNGNIIGGDYT